MGKIRVRNSEYSVGAIIRVMHHPLYETLFFLGSPRDKAKYTICVGIGIVKVIEIGQDFDFVKIDFGAGFSRPIIVKNNHARRQIYTLKKGQYAWFYGTICYYRENGKMQATLYAKAFQGWYVPKNMDIKQIDPNEIEKLSQENQSKINFIDELLKGEE